MMLTDLQIAFIWIIQAKDADGPILDAFHTTFLPFVKQLELIWILDPNSDFQ